jgi:replicative DNA helicase
MRPDQIERRQVGGYRQKQAEIIVPRLHRTASNAEHQLLGAMLIVSGDWGLLDRAIAIASVAEFHGQLEGIAFRTIAAYVRERRDYDPGLIYPTLIEHYGQEAGVVEQVLAWMDSVHSAWHMTAYAEAVVAAYQERASIYAVNEFAQSMQGGGDIATERLALTEKLKAIADINAGGDVAESSIDRLYDAAIKFGAESSTVGIPSGIKPLDDLLKGGPKPGQLIFVAARPSHGKSVLGAQWALSAAKRGTPAMVLSFEMLEAEVVGRLIDMAGVRRDEETSVEMFRSLPVYIRHSAGWTIQRIESETEAACRDRGVGCVVIDYLRLIARHNQRTDLREHLVELTGRLKQLAQKCKVPIIALTQLNRKIEDREEKTPRFEDIAESGSVEQDADIVVGLWRDEVSKVHVIKQRDGGQTGCVDVMLHPEKRLCVEVAQESEAPEWGQ